MNRIYLDYNATSPLAPAVTSWLAKGDLLWANPASQHSSGKKAAFLLDSTSDKLLNHFQLKNFQVQYHSGATEAINSAALGLWMGDVQLGKRPLFVFSPLDHAAVRAQAARLQSLGHATVELRVDREGQLLLAESIEAIKDAQTLIDGRTLINFTWVHNETGVVWPLKLAEQLKAATGALVHVDAAQTIAKVSDCFSLLPELDMYSYSSHKCGGFKAHGFSFIRKDWPIAPLILGGGQQRGLRSGTENVMGAYALELALSELKENFKPAEQQALITELRAFLDDALKGKGQRICAQAPALNLNTALFVINKLASDMSLPLFDLAGLEVSAGSACSSGAAKPSHVLEGLGYSTHSRNGLRLSVSLNFTRENWDELRPRLAQVLAKIPS